MTKKIALKIQIFDLHIDSPTHPSHSCLLAFRMEITTFTGVNLQLTPSITCRFAVFSLFAFPPRLAVLKQNLVHLLETIQSRTNSENSDFFFSYVPDNLLKRQKGYKPEMY